MTINTWRVSLLAVMLCMTEGYSRQRDTSSMSNGVRQQVASIAAAVVDSSGLRAGGEVMLMIESHDRRTTVENLFLESLQGRGVRVALPDSSSASKKLLLRISDVHFIQLGTVETGTDGDGVWRTELDARIEDPATGSAKFLGHFVRSVEGENGAGGSPSVLGKILEPLAVISGTVLIVYLFFTVRS